MTHRGPFQTLPFCDSVIILQLNDEQSVAVDSNSYLSCVRSAPQVLMYGVLCERSYSWHVFFLSKQSRITDTP